ncbi:MAG: vitamin K epoxide reductase family protein [Gemmatimonadales bacterium]|jgi:uncharacterized membrane protein
MAIAVLALVGFFVALYLWLWKVGWLGALACADGGCETVQLSQYAEVLGISVSLVGMLGYAALFGVALVGLRPAWLVRRSPTVALLVMSAGGTAYAGYLTYLEAWVIHAWCWWCVVSAILITAIFVAAAAGLISMRRPAAME